VNLPWKGEREREKRTRDPPLQSFFPTCGPSYSPLCVGKGGRGEERGKEGFRNAPQSPFSSLSSTSSNFRYGEEEEYESRGEKGEEKGGKWKGRSGHLDF